MAADISTFPFPSPFLNQPHVTKGKPFPSPFLNQPNVPFLNQPHVTKGRPFPSRFLNGGGNPKQKSSMSFSIHCHRATTSPPKTLTLDPTPLYKTLTAFAPATVANLGPGFDFLGCAVDSLGDTVTISINPDITPGQIAISNIFHAPKLSKNPNFNCAGIAAIEVLKKLKIKSVGLSMELNKGLPLGSGLGSSAASAAAAAVAVNALFGNILDDDDLILAGLESEKRVSGYHADNIAPAILGGFVLVRSYDPFEIMRLKFPEEKELVFVLVTPEFEAPTKKMREVLPKEVDMKMHVANSSQAAALVAGVLEGNVRVLGESMGRDVIVEPKRMRLIPGMEQVKKAAVEAGAFGCTISGAGPTVVAVIDVEEKGREIGEKMVKAFMAGGQLKANATVAKLDRVGARVIDCLQH